MHDTAANILKGLEQWTTREPAAPRDESSEFHFARSGPEAFPEDDPIERFRHEMNVRAAEDAGESTGPRRTVRRLRNSIEALIDGVMERDDELREAHDLHGVG